MAIFYFFYKRRGVTEDFKLPQMKAQKTHETTNTISKNIGEWGS